MKTRIGMVVGGALLLGSGAAVLALRGPSEAPRETPEVGGAPSAAQAAAPLQASRVACRFEPGQTLSYAAGLEAELHHETPGLNLPAHAKADLTGRLELEVLSSTEEAATLVAKVTLAPKATQSFFDVKAFRAPFLVTIDRACQLQAFARWKPAAEQVARTQQALLWDAQFRLGVRELGVKDSSGIAAATQASKGDLLQRSLDGYRSTWPGEPADLKVEGRMTVDLGPGPWFESLDSSRAQLATKLSNRSRLLLKRDAAEVAFAPAERDQGNYVWGDLLTRQPKLELVARPFTRFDRERQERVAPLTLPQALDAFVAKQSAGGGTMDKWPDLSAYFEVHPDAIKPAYSKYLKGELPPSSAGDFFLALGKTRNDEARELLLAIKRDDGAVMMDQVRAMFALVTRTDVGPGLAQELAADVHRHVARGNHDSDFLAGESMLALSTMSGLRNDTDVAHTTREALTSVLSSQGETTHPTHVALHAIGNTGDLTLLPVADRFLASADIDTRKAAVHVFSRMPPAATDATEVELLKRETSPFVKKEMYRVFQQQHVDMQQGASKELVDQTLSELRSTKSAYTRRNMVFLIAQSAVKDEPETRKALVEHARWERAKGTQVLNQFGTILTREERLEVFR
ncbi:MAG: hypothetical protein K1X89_05550 [Myxococcaceae bacterium]|nr:hypothetical protein [Myxococcaceae bacterium]